MAVLAVMNVTAMAGDTQLGRPLADPLLEAQVAGPAEPQPDTSQSENVQHRDAELRAAASAAAASATKAAEDVREAIAAARTLTNTVARAEQLLASSVKELRTANEMVAETQGKTAVIAENLKPIASQLVGPESTLVKMSEEVTNQTTTLVEIKREVSEKDPPQSILGSLDRAVDVSLALGIAGLSLAMLTFGTGLSSAAIKSARDEVLKAERDRDANTSTAPNVIQIHATNVTKAQQHLADVISHERILATNLQISLWAAVFFIGHAVFIDSVIGTRQSSACKQAIQDSAACLINEMKSHALSNKFLVFLDQGLGIALFIGAVGFLVFGVLQYRRDAFRS